MNRTLKRFISMLLTSTLLSAFTLSATASTDAKTLAPEAQTYINFSLGDENSSVDSIIPVQDTHGQEYAQFILTQADGEITGYMILCTLDDISTLLESGTGVASAAFAQYIAEKCTTDNPLIYVFPGTFIVKQSDNTYISVTEQTLEGTAISSLDSINDDTVAQIHQINETVDSKQPRLTEVSSLRNWKQGSFVPVIRNNTTKWYGCHQYWLYQYNFTTEAVSDTACGVAAASNAFHYLATNKSGKSKLFTKSSMSENSFASFMWEVGSYITPSPIGVFTTDMMASGAKSYAASKGVSLSTNKISMGSWTNAYSGVRSALSNDCPVLMLTSVSPVPNLKWHWVTITRLYMDNSNYAIVSTSNWADQKEVNFTLWYNTSMANTGLIYFS